jgi:hypothetical protein
MNPRRGQLYAAHRASKAVDRLIATDDMEVKRKAVFWSKAWGIKAGWNWKTESEREVVDGNGCRTAKT